MILLKRMPRKTKILKKKETKIQNKKRKTNFTQVKKDSQKKRKEMWGKVTINKTKENTNTNNESTVDETFCLVCVESYFSSSPGDNFVK